MELQGLYGGGTTFPVLQEESGEEREVKWFANVLATSGVLKSYYFTEVFTREAAVSSFELHHCSSFSKVLLGKD